MFDRTLASTPSAKLVVLVGYDHVEEAPRARSDGKGEFYWMAAELKRLSGVDPLTVEQTTFNPEAHPALEATEYRALLSRLVPPDSVVLYQGSVPVVLGRYSRRVDLQVLHPPSMMINGREAWRWAGARAIYPALPRTGSGGGGLFLAQALPEGHPGAAPLDQTITSTAAPTPLLVPRNARVRVRLTLVPPPVENLIRNSRGGSF